MKDGGAAFPRGLTHIGPDGHSELEWEPAQEGMSLRDWFAGQVLPSIAAEKEFGVKWDPQGVAHDAYSFADAMLAARERQA